MSEASNGGSEPGTTAWWYDTAKLVGPACPSCHRDDWSHTIGCPVERYYSKWRRLFDERAEQNVERLFGR